MVMVLMKMTTMTKMYTYLSPFDLKSLHFFFWKYGFSRQQSFWTVLTIGYSSLNPQWSTSTDSCLHFVCILISIGIHRQRNIPLRSFLLPAKKSECNRNAHCKSSVRNTTSDCLCLKVFKHLHKNGPRSKRLCLNLVPTPQTNCYFEMPITKLRENENIVCERILSEYECKITLDQMSITKSPGLDALVVELY